MPDKPTRRKFLESAGAAAAATLAPSARAAGSPAGRVSPPDASETNARLFVGCCAYSFHKHLEAGHMTMEDFFHKGVEMGVHGVDVTAYWLKSREPEYLASLRHLAFKLGLPFSGAACGASTVQADAPKRAKVLEDIKQWVDATELLGASHLRVFAGELPEGVTTAQGVAWTVETLKPAADYAARKGITLGIEDHGGITQRADVCLELLHKIDSPYVGINLDITNFIASSADEQYAQIEACAPYATHTHIRDTFGEMHPAMAVDLDRVWRIFAKAGYKGYMSAEYEGEEDAMTGVPKLMARIKELCKKYSGV